MREEKTVILQTHRAGTVTVSPAKRRRRRRLSPFAKTLIFLLPVLAGGMFGAWRLLRVGGVAVRGNTGYTASQIVAASGLKAGMPLFAVDGRRVGQKVCASLPMVGSARVVYRPPTGLVIVVAKSTAVAVASAKEGVVVLDGSWKVLEVVGDASRFSSFPLIKGVAFGKITPGSRITGEPLAQLKKAQSILSEVKKVKIAKITELDMSSAYQLTMNYDGRVSILLGTASDIPYKLKFAAGLLSSKIGAAEKGTLDVSQSAQSNRASFIPS